MLELNLGLNKQGSEDQGNNDEIKDIGNELAVEIVLDTVFQVPIANKLVPKEEEEEKNDGEKQISPREKGVEEVGQPRKGH